MNRAVYNAYEALIKRGEYTFFVINVALPTVQVDVNVHPAKLEVRFHNEWQVYHALNSFASAALQDIISVIPYYQKFY